MRWLSDTLGLFGVDDFGGSIDIRVHSSIGPCFTPPKTIYLVDFIRPENHPDTVFDTTAVMDCIAHEIGHAVTYFSSCLNSYYAEPFALNESFSDIFAIGAEFYSQHDSSCKYPNSFPGTADWLIGEDASHDTSKIIALRDIRYPQRDTSLRYLIWLDHIVQYSRWLYCTYYNGTTYWGNVEGHGRSGIQSFAFYLLSQGNDTIRYNDGHAYGQIAGIGIFAAIQVALRANIYHCLPHSSFVDSKLAWLKAAVELVEDDKLPPYAIESVASAWAAVGVLPELRFVNRSFEPTRTKVQVGRNGSLKLAHGDGASTSVAAFSLRFTRKGQWNAYCVAIDTVNYRSLIYRKCLYINKAAFLDDCDSLSGGLVIKGPDGKANMHIDSTGVIRIRHQNMRSAF